MNDAADDRERQGDEQRGQRRHARGEARAGQLLGLDVRVAELRGELLDA